MSDLGSRSLSRLAFGARMASRAGCGRVSRVIVSCSVGGLSLTQGDEHGEGFEEEPRGETAGGVERAARRVVGGGDTLNGGNGADYTNGGEDTDTCRRGETTARC